MWDPRSPWAQGSFQSPVPIPMSGPGDLPLLCLAINEEWMPYVIGCLKQLMLPATWGDMRDPAVQAAQSAANDLIALFSEATDCGADSMAGAYAESCLGANLSLATLTLTDVVSVSVTPGEYHLVATLQFFTPSAAGNVIARLYDGSGNVLSEGEFTTPGATFSESMTLDAHVVAADASTYYLKVQSQGASEIFADTSELSSGFDVATCIRAYPLGISGPVGADGPPGPAYMLRFNDSCGFEYSIDGGSTWTALSGWLENAAHCFPGFDGGLIPIADIDPGDPPTVGDTTVNQRACNISAYLAQVVIRGALNTAQSQAALTKTALDFGVALLALIPGIDIATLGFVEGANILYQLVDGDSLSDFTAAASDETLWADVTCAIFGCIVDDGEVTASNFDCVTAALGAITYAHTEVPTALALFWAGLGLQAVRAAQIAGALEVADCTGCAGFGPWCTWWQGGERDMCNGDWVGITGGETATPSTCGGGVFSSVNNGAGGEFVVVQTTLPFTRTITTVRVDYSGGALDVFSIQFYDASDTLLGTAGSTNWKSADSLGPMVDVKRIVVTKGSGDSAFYLGSIKVGGPDSGSPWGESNGTCD